MQRIGGIRRRSRSKLKKHYKQRGKVSLRKYFQSFKEGDRVVLCAEPSIQKGIYHMRFHGKTGIIIRLKGKHCNVLINDKGKEKIILAHPVHLKKVGE
ncbi:MAG: 50S ribosomal protein L21e [Candidatus Woesearchaeota archaeon]